MIYVILSLAQREPIIYMSKLDIQLFSLQVIFLNKYLLII